MLGTNQFTLSNDSGGKSFTVTVESNTMYEDFGDSGCTASPAVIPFALTKLETPRLRIRRAGNCYCWGALTRRARLCQPSLRSHSSRVRKRISG